MLPSAPSSSTVVLPATPADACRGLQQMIFGFAQSRLLFSAIELNVFAHIAQGCQSAPALSAALGTEARATRMFLDGLVGIGLLQKAAADPPRYTLSEAYAPYLLPDSPDYLGGLIVHGRRLADAWGALTEVVRRGRTSGRAQALSVVEEQFAELVSGMAVANDASARALASHLTALGLQPPAGQAPLRILDVGCGTGHWSAALLAALPHSEATLVDFPRVIDVATRHMAAQGLSQRAHTLAGDLEDITLAPQAYDLAILANLCHAIGPQAAQEALKNVVAALAPAGHLVIIEPLADDSRAEAGWPLVFGVNMLVSSDEGDVITQAQCEAWLAPLGMTLQTKIPLSAPLSAMLFSRKPCP